LKARNLAPRRTAESLRREEQLLEGARPMNADSRSADELERALERTRSVIGETLDEIQHQLSLGMGVGELIVRNPLPVTLIGLGFSWRAFSGSRNRRFEHHDRSWAELSRDRPLPYVERNVLMAVSRENLAEWLRDARTMEDLAIETLEKQASRLDQYPELQARLREHLAETRRQAEKLDGCMQRLGAGAVATSPRTGRLPGGPDRRPARRRAGDPERHHRLCL
jgi:Domain of unknown function (DUF892)